MPLISWSRSRTTCSVAFLAVCDATWSKTANMNRFNVYLLAKKKEKNFIWAMSKLKWICLVEGKQCANNNRACSCFCFSWISMHANVPVPTLLGCCLECLMDLELKKSACSLSCVMLQCLLLCVVWEVSCIMIKNRWWQCRNWLSWHVQCWTLNFK